MSGPDKKTDNSKLVTGPTVYVSPDGGYTNEPFPQPNVEYDFCIEVANGGELPSGPFFVRFHLSGDQSSDLDFPQDAGLDSSASVLALVHYGTFPNQQADYNLSACVYSPSAQQEPIRCAGEFGFYITATD